MNFNKNNNNSDKTNSSSSFKTARKAKGKFCREIIKLLGSFVVTKNRHSAGTFASMEHKVLLLFLLIVAQTTAYYISFNVTEWRTPLNINSTTTWNNFERAIDGNTTTFAQSVYTISSSVGMITYNYGFSFPNISYITIR